MGVTISGCLIIENKKLLLLHRRERDHWELPGGKIKTNENPKQTARREVKEEIGCDVKLLQYLSCFEFVLDNRNFISHCFLAEIIKGRPKLMEKDVFDKLDFIQLDKLKNYNLSPNVKTLITKIKLERF